MRFSQIVDIHYDSCKSSLKSIGKIETTKLKMYLVHDLPFER